MNLWIVALAASLPAGLAFRDGQKPLGHHDSDVQVEKQMDELLQALNTMQTQFFEPWIGTWPEAIDWTRAVMGTHLTAAANTYSRYGPANEHYSIQNENVVGGIFSQLVAYYFGEDAGSIRFQAYDDMLWVVLGWLDTVQLSEQHSQMHFASTTSFEHNSTWYGKSFSPAFAHRARIFWELASKGWDEELCGGGMIWNPRLTPYKNAITNELFIAASINMYLYFPGDDNSSPFSKVDKKPGKKHDKQYLDAAVKAYDWLIDSNMTDEQGLFFDGFHVRGWRRGDIGTGKCDVPDKKVYTYNQGVVLSGHRGLWSATGDTTYLMAGHELIRNVIAATGWSIETDAVVSNDWSGLGRNGVLEDGCDSGGFCSQDGQTFKGIFFHHITVFCRPLAIGPQKSPLHGADRKTATLHLNSCLQYSSWIQRNADAVLGTRDANGVFGMWWTIGLSDQGSSIGPSKKDEDVDYRNEGIPDSPIWQIEHGLANHARFSPGRSKSDSDDPNERGRGRTVETQSGGVAVLRAQTEFSALRMRSI